MKPYKKESPFQRAKQDSDAFYTSQEKMELEEPLLPGDSNLASKSFGQTQEKLRTPDELLYSCDTHNLSTVKRNLNFGGEEALFNEEDEDEETSPNARVFDVRKTIWKSKEGTKKKWWTSSEVSFLKGSQSEILDFYNTNLP